MHPYPTLGEAVQQCALNYNRASWAKLGRPGEAGKHMVAMNEFFGGVRKMLDGFHVYAYVYI